MAEVEEDPEEAPEWQEDPQAGAPEVEWAWEEWADARWRRLRLREGEADTEGCTAAAVWDA